jgi:hypothetical protein
MSFFGITFSGADETVEPESLNGLRGSFFDIEWGILASLDRQGKCAGYPRIDWIKRLSRARRAWCSPGPGKFIAMALSAEAFAEILAP